MRTIKTNPDDKIHATFDHQFPNLGLTKREYFAAIAMQGLVVTAHASPLSPEDIAHNSIFMADALIRQLNKEVKDE